MRIFQILEFNQFNTGSVHQMFQAAAGLRERGHEVTIVSRPAAVLQSKSEDAGVQIPFRATRRSGPQTVDRRVTNITLNQPIDPGLFTRPQS